MSIKYFTFVTRDTRYTHPNRFIKGIQEYEICRYSKNFGKCTLIGPLKKNRMFKSDNTVHIKIQLAVN